MPFVIKYSKLPSRYVYYPYFISQGFSEEDLINGVFSEFGKPLAMWECNDTEEAERWVKYLRSRV